MTCRSTTKAGIVHHAKSPHAQPTPSMETDCGNTVSIMNRGKGGVDLASIPATLLTDGMRRTETAPEAVIKITADGSIAASDTYPPCCSLQRHGSGGEAAERLV